MNILMFQKDKPSVSRLRENYVLVIGMATKKRLLLFVCSIPITVMDLRSC